jgi:hypothetical protein
MFAQERAVAKILNASGVEREPSAGARPAVMCQGIGPAIFALLAVGETPMSDEAAIVAMDRDA